MVQRWAPRVLLPLCCWTQEPVAGAAGGAEDLRAPQDPQQAGAAPWHRTVILCGKQLFRMQLEVADLLTHCPGSALLFSPFPLLWGEASLREGFALAHHSPQLCPRQLVQVAAFVLFLRQIVFTSILPASPQWDTFFPESLTCVCSLVSLYARYLPRAVEVPRTVEAPRWASSVSGLRDRTWVTPPGPCTPQVWGQTPSGFPWAESSRCPAPRGQGGGGGMGFLGLVEVPRVWAAQLASRSSLTGLTLTEVRTHSLFGRAGNGALKPRGPGATSDSALHRPGDLASPSGRPRLHPQNVTFTPCVD